MTLDESGLEVHHFKKINLADTKPKLLPSKSIAIKIEELTEKPS